MLYGRLFRLGFKTQSKVNYINKVGDKYYLYAAHSERVPDTKKSQEGL